MKRLGVVSVKYVNHANWRLRNESIGISVARFHGIAWLGRYDAEGPGNERRDSASKLAYYPARQIAAGGGMELEVASVRPAEPGMRWHSNIGLTIEDEPILTGGRLSSTAHLADYIDFAYKLMLVGAQSDAVYGHPSKTEAAQQVCPRMRSGDCPRPPLELEYGVSISRPLICQDLPILIASIQFVCSDLLALEIRCRYSILRSILLPYFRY